jgi:DNA-binding IclR family transcriptional regulator
MNNYIIPNLLNACKILSILANEPEGISTNRLENLVEVPRTTAFRILKTLCSAGMAEKRGRLYFPGPRLVQVGLNSLRYMEIRTLSIPFLGELAMKTGLTAHLAIPSGMESMILEVHDSPHPVRVASRPGTTVPLYCSSTGKVFLAYLHEHDLEDYFKETSLQKFTDNTIISLDQMRQEVEQVKSNGFSVDNCEFHEDVWCLAAPVRDGTDQITAAIGVTGPSSQSHRQGISELSKQVKQTAQQLSASLGYHT